MGFWNKAQRAAIAVASVTIINLLVGCSAAVPDADGSDGVENVGTQQEALTAPAWQANKAYAANSLVSYQGKLYRCVQAHTSAVGWEPPNVPALWAFEGLDTGSNTNTGPTGPNGPITLDYVTLQADCDSFPETCCATGSTKTSLTSNSDVRTFANANECVLSLGGADTLTVTGTGKSSLNLGAGNDTAMDGPGDNFIWGGFGDDTINGYGGTNLFFGGWGNDTIKAANGTNTVIPGPGVDTVSLGTGDDTVYIFDLCEVVSGKKLDAGTGFDTLYTPIPLADLRARGMTVDNFERIIVQDNHCRSQCGNHLGCSYCANDDDHDGTFNCQDECPLDPAKTTPGLCNCGVSEVDSDGDSVPDCMDDCKLDAQTSYRGQCRCPHDAAPNGTICEDGVTPGASTCNNGVCGSPTSSAPQPNCVLKTNGWHAYWFCPAATVAQATTRCAAVPGRKLIQIDTRQENAFAAKFVSAESWIGAVDRTTEGEFSWLNAAGQEKKKLWTGGANGKSYKGLFQSWSGGNPGSDAAKDCATISSDRGWRVQSCNDSRPYVCEAVFGPGRIPGPGGQTPPAAGPGGIIPGWNTSSNGGGGGSGGGGDGSDVDDADCTDEPTPAALAVQKQQLEDCAAHCSPTLPQAEQWSEPACNTACQGAASRPPEGSRCSGNGEPLSQVLMSSGGEGKCSVENQDCSAIKFLGFLPTHCGVEMKCLDVTHDSGAWAARTCAEGCRAGTTCNTALGKCINPDLHSVCDTATSVGRDCFGQCFSQVGCGIGGRDLADGDDGKPCSETRVCTPEYADGLNPGSTLLDPTPWTDDVLPDLTGTPAPTYVSDFLQPCQGTCVLCLGDTINDPACRRAARHSWCNYDQTTVGAPDAAVTDNRAGDRGNTSSVIKFTVDPGADLDFNVKPLPFGVSDFSVEAAAAIRATAEFNLGPISGSVELIDLRGALSASLCHVATDSSHIEVLGLDFLPALTKATGTSKVIFNTDKDWTGGAACDKAVAAYIDAVDRAKKALRDAQDLVTQFNDFRDHGRTFDAAFCKNIAGPGMRPPGMTGSCDLENPADTVNAFVDFYALQARQIGVALDTLSKSVLNSSQLGQILGQSGGSGFAFFAPIGDVVKGFGDKETVTILEMNFVIGPVPCNLEVTSYMNYGIVGGFGANLEPSALISGGGAFAKAGAVIKPYADAGVTLFVGVGFSAGPFSLKLGIEGAVTLGNINLPATVAAGLSMVPEKDDRPLPEDVTKLSSGEVLFPPNIGAQKYNFQFDYSYGVDLTVSDMLNGNIDAALKIKFLFFSKRWSKRIISFKSGLQIGPLNLIGGGSYDAAKKQHETPVPSDVKTWKSSYASVPFLALTHVNMPQAAPPLANGSFNPSRAGELFYDSECKCEAIGADCNRKADCCSDTASCFSDPLQGGKHICRECGPPAYVASCNVPEDCCGTDVACNADDWNECHDEPNPDCNGSGGSGGSGNTGTGNTGGGVVLCFPIQKCTLHHFDHKVCRPKPVIPDPPVVTK